MKKSLVRREKRIWRAAPVVLAAAWVLLAAYVPPASAQEGPGLTVGVGLRRRGGLFFEMKVGAFDSPDFKLGVGYTFR